MVHYLIMSRLRATGQPIGPSSRTKVAKIDHITRDNASL